MSDPFTEKLKQIWTGQREAFLTCTPEQLAAMYGYPGPSDADGWDVPAPPCDVEAVYPAPVEAKAAEPVPQDDCQRMWDALREIAQG